MIIVGAKFNNSASLEKALVNAFKRWAKEDINEAHWDDQFKDMGRWDYDNETKRKKTGEVVGSPRDIYDYGLLYESGVNSFKINESPSVVEASWHWNAKNSSGEEYAWYVHYGKSTNVTARPFTDDISIPSSFFHKTPGKALVTRIRAELTTLNAN
jgi:hypothetical protein